MKKSMQGLMVMAAVVSSFLTAHVVAAETVAVEGFVQEIIPCEQGGCASIVVQICTAEPKGNTANGKIFIECSEEEETVYGLRTIDYWANYNDGVGVDYPVVGDYVTIEAEVQPCEDLVAINMEVCEVDDRDEIVNCEYIELHDADEAL
ncbi:MAG: hypothetical protein KKC76_05780 [Proteobacteria bacterium]|nr:hypothetical protein [Pseudomonadota bacterium]MBU4296230.1 hypothetical protein [Pseudomonadota bacterium]MCG2746412.1 hypothetical protein [Desulfobulbaceae bacterium]